MQGIYGLGHRSYGKFDVLQVKKDGTYLAHAVVYPRVEDDEHDFFGDFMYLTSGQSIISVVDAPEDLWLVLQEKVDQHVRGMTAFEHVMLYIY